MEGFFRQRPGGAGGDCLIGVAQPLAHADCNVLQPRLRQPAAEGGYAVRSPHQGEDPAVSRHVGGDVPVPAVEADTDYVLVAGAQPGAQNAEGAETRKDLHPAVREEGQELLCAAEEARVAAHGHGIAAELPVVVDVGGDLLRGHGLVSGLTGAANRLQHPARADDALRLRQGPEGLAGHGLPAAGADAHHGHPGTPGEAVVPAELGDDGSQVQPRPLGRTAHRHQDGPGLPGGGSFLRKSPGPAGVLGHQIPGGDGPQHGRVHFPGKGPLHGNDVAGGQPRLPTGPEGVLHGQNPGVGPVRESPHITVKQYLFTACGQQDIAVGPIQKGHGGGDVRDKDRVPGGLLRVPEEAEIERAGFLTGGGDVLRDLPGIGVGGVHHQVEPLPGQQVRHLLRRHAPGGDGEVLRRGQQGLAVVRGHAGGDGDILLACQELHQLPALGGAGEDAELIHPGTPGASPAAPRWSGSGCCR